jgi:serine/threonine protein kinase
MSRVFLAEETRLGRQVVIKLLPPDMGASVNVERFEREIQLAARLQHPHIVPLLAAAASGDLLYYIMPYIAGESLGPNWPGRESCPSERPPRSCARWWTLFRTPTAMACAPRHQA